jgi:hypothetical protein
MSVGELNFISDRGFQNNQLCGCGEPFRECSFWKEVVSLAAGPAPDEWFGRLAYLKKSTGRTRRFPTLALSQHVWTGMRLASQSVEYATMLGKIISAVSAVSGADLIIDSSKEPVHGFHLGQCQTIDLYPAHLVRDSRAVAFSLQRVKVRPEIYWKTELMPRSSPTRSAFDWSLINLFMQELGNLVGNYYRILYEEFVENPQESSISLLKWAGIDNDVSLQESTRPGGIGEHELSGNPMRFEREFRIVPDQEWINRMGTRDYAVTTAISAPLLLKYGYSLGRPSRIDTDSG